jgi:hypothetical protein
MLKRLVGPVWAVLEYGWYPLVLLVPVAARLWHERQDRRLMRAQIDAVVDHEPVP